MTVPEDDDARQALLARLANSDLGTVEARVAYILQHYPETRDDNVALCLRYWRRFEADELEGSDPTSLEILYSIEKASNIERQQRTVQNAYGLFEGNDTNRQRRSEIQREFYQEVARSRAREPEIRLYLDETGNDPSSRFTGLAGICILDWRHYEKHYYALKLWRENRGWPDTIRFTETDAENAGRARLLLDQLRKRRNGLLFVGHSVLSRGSTHLHLFNLFVQIVSDSLRKAEQQGCLDVGRTLRVIKEAEEGFDKIYLESLEQALAERLARDLPGRVAVAPIEAIPKGRETLLECADLIAGAMRRRALYSGRNPKDALAEAVFNVTGFEDTNEEGIVFRCY